MSDSNSRLVYSTQTGRIEEPKNGAGFVPKGMVSFAFSVKPVAVRVKAYV